MQLTYCMPRYQAWAAETSIIKPKIERHFVRTVSLSVYRLIMCVCMVAGRGASNQFLDDSTPSLHGCSKPVAVCKSLDLSNLYPARVLRILSSIHRIAGCPASTAQCAWFSLWEWRMKLIKVICSFRDNYTIPYDLRI